ncbi:hypothetical protein T07_2367 [Trichinella nelsoni]|uniref:Uncharacterized protein n=1 Tax=Trichinella nelsoni TaxID=6336 RepID=A0A0V0RF70_9BILA|nr:hypothetical protein T07_2367 [Trichinella nelsoni]
MVRAQQESLTVKIGTELAQGPYQAEDFSPSRAIPTLSLGQRATLSAFPSLWLSTAPRPSPLASTSTMNCR